MTIHCECSLQKTLTKKVLLLYNGNIHFWNDSETSSSESLETMHCGGGLRLFKLDHVTPAFVAVVTVDQIANERRCAFGVLMPHAHCPVIHAQNSEA